MDGHRAHGNFNVLANYAWYIPGVSDMFILLAWLIAGTFLGSLATFLFTLAAGSDAAMKYGMLVAYPLLFIPAMMFVANKSRANSLETTGLALDNSNFAPVGGFLCAILAMLGTFAASFAADAAGLVLPPMPERLEKIMESMTGGVLWVNILCVSIMAPFFEEWLCRGMILRGLLYKNIKPVWAIVISALFFALIHANPWQGIPAFALGCLFGYVYYKTGSLRLTMLMHFTNNTVAVLVSKIPALENVDSWPDLLGNRYWPYFILAIVIVGLVVLAFKKISVEKNFEKIEPLSLK